MAVVRLKKDIDDCRIELELARKQTPAVALRGGRGSRRQDIPGSRTGSNTVRCLKPLYVIELEMLARSAFIDIDTSIQLQMVQDRFIDGQAQICPPQLVARERSTVTELETMLLNWLPVRTVTEEDAASPNPSADSAEGCFFVWGFDPYDGPMSDSRRVNSVFAYGMAGGTHRRPVHSGTGSSSGAPKPADGKRRLIQGEGLVARISDDYRPQLPVVGEDIPGPAVPCHVGTARLLETVINQTGSVGRAVRWPYSDSDESDNDVLYAEEHDNIVRQVSLRNEWLTQTADDSRGVHSWTISIGFCRPMIGHGCVGQLEMDV